MTIPEQAVEAAAKKIYELLPYNETSPPIKPPWIPRGNSFKQDEARRYAIAALEAASLVGVKCTEDVARIIDPHAFKSWQSMYDYSIKRAGDNDAEARRCADYFHKKDIDEALAKAAAILALPHTAQPQEGAALLHEFIARQRKKLEEIRGNTQYVKGYGDALSAVERVCALSAAPASPQRAETAAVKNLVLASAALIADWSADCKVEDSTIAKLLEAYNAIGSQRLLLSEVEREISPAPPVIAEPKLDHERD